MYLYFFKDDCIKDAVLIWSELMMVSEIGRLNILKTMEIISKCLYFQKS